MRELDAKDKNCPYTFGLTGARGMEDYLCCGSHCMAWIDDGYKITGETKVRYGHCSLMGEGRESHDIVQGWLEG